jgi:integrase/recombinase XerD
MGRHTLGRRSKTGLKDRGQGDHRKRSLGATALERAIASYLEWLTVRHFRPTSVEKTGRALALFADWALERGLEAPHEVTLAILERYQRSLYEYRKANEEPLSIGTQANRLIALRGLFSFLVRQRYLGANPAADLLLPKAPVRLPRDVLTREEVEVLLAAPVIAEPLGLRDRAILELFYSTGLRRSELLRLQVFDVDLVHGTLFVREGKGGKDRVVPVGERALLWLQKYLASVRPQVVSGRDSGEIFLSELGEPLSGVHLGYLVRRYLQRSGLRQRGGCHLLRHTMATLMLENGADIRYIQEMLGHSKLDTTAVYTRVTIKKLKEIHTATHPGARLVRQGSSEEELTLLP